MSEKYGFAVLDALSGVLAPLGDTEWFNSPEGAASAYLHSGWEGTNEEMLRTTVLICKEWTGEIHGVVTYRVPGNLEPTKYVVAVVHWVREGLMEIFYAEEQNPAYK